MRTVAEKICSVESCEKLAGTKGYCPAHYQRQRRGLDLNASVASRRSRLAEPVACSFEGCLNPAVDPNRDRLCGSHWKQKNLHHIELRPLRAWSKQSGVCRLDNCGALPAKAGFCSRHYHQQHAGLELTNLHLRGDFDRSRPCVISGCEKLICSSTLLCKTHESLCWTHKLSSVQLEMLWAGGCSICGSNTKRLHIDHDHKCCSRKVSGRKDFCGECIRGCLCNDCNIGIGFLGDDVDRLLGAASYLLTGPTAR